MDELVSELIEDIKIELPHIKNYWGTIASMYRLLIPNILPKNITKVIYLDADTIINLDINELWQIDLGNHSIAAVTEMESGASSDRMNAVFPLVTQGIIEPEKYFNAGMLVLNLEGTILGGDAGYLIVA